MSVQAPFRAVDGIAVRFTRRRYSNRTYTWVSALLDGAWTELGDPWPSVKVSDNEIRIAIARVKKYPTCGYREQGGEAKPEGKVTA